MLENYVIVFKNVIFCGTAGSMGFLIIEMNNMS